MTENDFYENLDFYGLYLRRALQRAKKSEADNMGFLKVQQKKAQVAFSRAKKAGHCVFICRQYAFNALTEGIDFSHVSETKQKNVMT